MGDIESMPFIEAFRQFQFKVKKENFCNIHVSLVPQVGHTGEHACQVEWDNCRITTSALCLFFEGKVLENSKKSPLVYLSHTFMLQFGGGF